MVRAWHYAVVALDESQVPMKVLIAAFSSAAKAALVDRGWTKRSGDIYTLDLGDGFLAWLGFNRASKHHPLEVSPVVGVVYEPARKLEQRLSGLTPAITPSLSEPLRYLADDPPVAVLRVTNPADAESGAAELVQTIEMYGLPFVRSLATRDALATALRERRHIVREYAITRLPATLASFGLEAEARQAMAAGLKELGDRTDPAADHVRAFAEALATHLGG